MAYINLNPKDKNYCMIYNSIDFIDECDQENYVEVDEMIAPVIAVLNKKGYKTVYCCSGHPYPSRDMIYPENTFVHLATYIAFEDGTKLPSCPDNAILEVAENLYQPVIRIRENAYYMTENHSYYDMLVYIVEIMKSWYDWAVSLPEYNASNNTRQKIYTKCKDMLKRWINTITRKDNKYEIE